MNTISEIMKRAYQDHKVIPSFNIPHLEMMEPVIRALKDTDTFALIAVARLEWRKFQAQSIDAIADCYGKYGDFRCTRLHLDHIPVIDEDGFRVDYMKDISHAIDVGFHSVMVDGSLLGLSENIACTKRVVDYAHARQIPVEAELGAVLGHESGPLPEYEELFKSKRGFTKVGDAKRFAQETGVDWLSVAVGSIHGAISPSALDRKKVTARLDIERLTEIDKSLGLPLVLHGGSGIDLSYLLKAFEQGIGKLNIGTEIRQTFEQETSVAKGQQKLYAKILEIVESLQISGSAGTLNF
jgi:ketose-bisphosphate aldolase